MLTFSSGPSSIAAKDVVKANLLQAMIDDLMSNIRQYMKDNEAVVEYQKQPSGFVTLLFNPLLSAKSAIEDYETTVKKCALAEEYNKDMTSNEMLVNQKAFQTSDCLVVLKKLNQRNEDEIAAILKDITSAGIPAGEYDAWLQAIKNVMSWIREAEIISCLSLALKYQQQKFSLENQAVQENQPGSEPPSAAKQERMARDSAYIKLMSDLFEFLFTTMYKLHFDASKSIQPKLYYKRIVPKEQYAKMIVGISTKMNAIDTLHRAFENSDQRFTNIAGLLGDLLRDMEKLNETLLPSAFTANAFISAFTEKLNEFNDGIKSLDPANKTVSKDKKPTPAPSSLS